MFRNKDYIYCIYKEGSFSKAAEMLHISQPSISAVVSRLEKRFGTQIFNRKTKPVTVTSFGLEYIRAIEQIQEIEEHLQTLSYEIHTLQSGHLSIGGSSLDNPYIITQVITKFKKLYPNIQLDIRETNTTQSKILLDEGILDLVITNQPMDLSRYEAMFCYDETLLWAIPKSFSINESLRSKALAKDEIGNAIVTVPDDRCIGAVQLMEIPFILLDNTNYLRTCADMIFQESGIQPKVTLETENPSISYNFARQGIGATIISNRLIENMPHDESLQYYKISSQYRERNAYAYYSQGRYVTIAMKKFMELLKNSGS